MEGSDSLPLRRLLQYNGYKLPDKRVLPGIFIENAIGKRAASGQRDVNSLRVGGGGFRQDGNPVSGADERKHHLQIFTVIHMSRQKFLFQTVLDAGDSGRDLIGIAQDEAF